MVDEIAASWDATSRCTVLLSNGYYRKKMGIYMADSEVKMDRVLIVDDDPMVTRLVRINLELEDFEVVEAWDGKTAVEIIKNTPPDLLLLDIMMPQMDGWEILKKVREDPQMKNLPVVVLTAKVQDEDIARGWRMGADGYIVKPFNPVSLADTLRQVLSTTPLEREERRSQEIARMKDIQLEE
jgi:DNA-binding response OmpR family regulator